QGLAPKTSQPDCQRSSRPPAPRGGDFAAIVLNTCPHVKFRVKTLRVSAIFSSDFVPLIFRPAAPRSSPLSRRTTLLGKPAMAPCSWHLSSDDPAARLD